MKRRNCDDEASLNCRNKTLRYYVRWLILKESMFRLILLYQNSVSEGKERKIHGIVVCAGRQDEAPIGKKFWHDFRMVDVVDFTASVLQRGSDVLRDDIPCDINALNQWSPIYIEVTPFYNSWINIFLLATR